jgi:hypothetical protein
MKDKNGRVSNGKVFWIIVMIITFLFGIYYFISSSQVKTVTQHMTPADISKSESGTGMKLRLVDNNGNPVEVPSWFSSAPVDGTYAIVKSPSPTTCTLTSDCSGYATNPNIMCWGGNCVLGNIAGIYLDYGITNPGYPNNLINPGFESSDAWTPSGADSTHTISFDSTTSHSGSSSLHLSVINSSKNWFSVYATPISTIPGRVYYIEMWVKTSSLPAATGLSNGTGGYPDRFMLEVSEYNTTTAPTTSTQRKGTASSIGISGDSSSHSTWDTYRNRDWTKLTGTYTVTSGTTYFIPRLFLYTTNGDIWYDDITIYYGTAGSQTKFLNVGVVSASPAAFNTNVNKSVVSVMNPGETISFDMASPMYIAANNWTNTNQTFSITARGTNEYTGVNVTVSDSYTLGFYPDPTGSFNLNLIKVV